MSPKLVTLKEVIAGKDSDAGLESRMAVERFGPWLDG
jgi:hypothetical protein